MFAIVLYNKNQYKLIPGKEAKIDLLKGIEENQKEIVFSDILLVSDDKKVLIGEPKVVGTSVKAEILKNGREDKIRVFKFRAKKRYKKTYGQKKDYTLIKVLEIKNEK